MGNVLEIVEFVSGPRMGQLIMVAGIIGLASVFRKPLKRLAVKAVSTGIDTWYDLKYTYWVELPEIADVVKSELDTRRQRAELIKVHNLDYYIIYRWSDGSYYLTVDSLPPYLNSNSSNSAEVSDDESGKCNIKMFFGNDSRDAGVNESVTLTSLAGPGQDFTISTKPSLSDIQLILSLPGLTKVIFNNSSYEEFIFC